MTRRRTLHRVAGPHAATATTANGREGIPTPATSSSGAANQDPPDADRTATIRQARTPPKIAPNVRGVAGRSMDRAPRAVNGPPAGQPFTRSGHAHSGRRRWPIGTARPDNTATPTRCVLSIASTSIVLQTSQNRWFSRVTPLLHCHFLLHKRRVLGCRATPLHRRVAGGRYGSDAGGSLR
jgi:hypothetical protein